MQETEQCGICGVEIPADEKGVCLRCVEQRLTESLYEPVEGAPWDAKADERHALRSQLLEVRA